MTIPYAYERQVAELAALRAAILTKRVQASVTEGVSKADKSPVTAADFAAQALLIAALREAFPNDGFIGEEGAEELQRPGNEALLRMVDRFVTDAADVDGPDGRKLARPKDLTETLSFINMGGTGQGGPRGRFWVMDPVDGTKTFLTGNQYAVSLSLIEDGREVVGVLCCPNLKLSDGRVHEDSVDTDGLGVMLTAVRGQGSTVRVLSESPKTTPYVLPEAQRLPLLTAAQELRELHIVNSRMSPAIDQDVIKEIATKTRTTVPETSVWSSHMRYASLILGGADCQVRVPAKPRDGRGPPKVCIWDHAGAQLIFTEAGGKVTDLDGKPIDFGAGRTMSNNRGMLIARGAVHKDISDLVEEITRPTA